MLAIGRIGRTRSRARLLALTGLGWVAGLALAPSAGAVCAPPVPGGAGLVVTCPPVGREQSFVVPPGVTSLRIVAVGASGGAGASGGGQGGGGGPGAVVSAELPARPGATLFVLVGGIGRTQVGGQPGAGGFNGGGSGGGQGGAATGLAGPGSGGGGGGASDVRLCSTRHPTCDSLASRLLVAAGGGGGGGATHDFSTGGSGGAGATTGDGANGSPSAFVEAPVAGGFGATPAAGGAGAAGAGPGDLGIGGPGASVAAGVFAGAGGGGGAGRFGGGGGAAGVGDFGGGGAGGGGGSSFGPAGAAFATASARQGSVTITYIRPGSADTRPAVVITQPRAGALLPRAGLITGRAIDPSGVRAVALRIERLPRGRRSDGARRCRWLVGQRLRRGSCARPPSLRAKLSADGAWSYRVPAGLPGGRYRVTAYGSDETGLYGNSAPGGAGSLTFRRSAR